MDTIDRYLASDLDAAERIRFDERLSNEPSLASELARQRLLSEALRRVVPQPRTGLAIDILARAVATRGLERTSAPSQPWLAKPLPLIGASLATIALVAGTLVWTGVIPGLGFGGGGGGGGGRGATTPYASVMSHGFVPSMVETDPNALEALLAEKFSTTIVLKRGPAIKYLGVRTDLGGSPLAIGILAKVGERQVLLIIDKLGARPSDGTPNRTPAGNRKQTRELSPGLYHHEQVKGQITLAEWSSSDEALLISE